MSNITNGWGKMKTFPIVFVKNMIRKYHRQHGVYPTLLRVSENDYFDYIVTHTIPPVEILVLKRVSVNEDLMSNQIDLTN